MKDPGRTQAAPPDGAALLAALGGRQNLQSLELGADRLLVRLHTAADVNEAALGGLGVRGIARPAAGPWQLLLGPAAEAAYTSLKAKLGS